MNGKCLIDRNLTLELATMCDAYISAAELRSFNKMFIKHTMRAKHLIIFAYLTK